MGKGEWRNEVKGLFFFFFVLFLLFNTKARRQGRPSGCPHACRSLHPKGHVAIFHPIVIYLPESGSQARVEPGG